MLRVFLIFLFFSFLEVQGRQELPESVRGRSRKIDHKLKQLYRHEFYSECEEELRLLLAHAVDLRDEVLLFNLATVCSQGEKYDEAIEMYKSLLGREEKVLEPSLRRDVAMNLLITVLGSLENKPDRLISYSFLQDLFSYLQIAQNSQKEYERYFGSEDKETRSALKHLHCIVQELMLRHFEKEVFLQSAQQNDPNKILEKLRWERENLLGILDLLDKGKGEHLFSYLKQHFPEYLQDETLPEGKKEKVQRLIQMNFEKYLDSLQSNTRKAFLESLLELLVEKRENTDFDSFGQSDAILSRIQEEFALMIENSSDPLERELLVNLQQKILEYNPGNFSSLAIPEMYQVIYQSEYKALSILFQKIHQKQSVRSLQMAKKCEKLGVYSKEALRILMKKMEFKIAQEEQSPAFQAAFDLLMDEGFSIGERISQSLSLLSPEDYLWLYLDVYTNKMSPFSPPSASTLLQWELDGENLLWDEAQSRVRDKSRNKEQRGYLVHSLYQRIRWARKAAEAGDLRNVSYYLFDSLQWARRIKETKEDSEHLPKTIVSRASVDCEKFMEGDRWYSSNENHSLQSWRKQVLVRQQSLEWIKASLSIFPRSLGNDSMSPLTAERKKQALSLFKGLMQQLEGLQSLIRDEKANEEKIQMMQATTLGYLNEIEELLSDSPNGGASENHSRILNESSSSFKEQISFLQKMHIEDKENDIIPKKSLDSGRPW